MQKDQSKQRNQGNFSDIENEDAMGGGFSNAFVVGNLQCRQALLHSFREIKIVGGLFQLFCILTLETWGRVTS